MLPEYVYSCHIIEFSRVLRSEYLSSKFVRIRSIMAQPILECRLQLRGGAELVTMEGGGDDGSGLEPDSYQGRSFISRSRIVFLVAFEDCISGRRHLKHTFAQIFYSMSTAPRSH